MDDGARLAGREREREISFVIMHNNGSLLCGRLCPHPLDFFSSSSSSASSWAVCLSCDSGVRNFWSSSFWDHGSSGLVFSHQPPEWWIEFMELWHSRARHTHTHIHRKSRFAWATHTKRQTHTHAAIWRNVRRTRSSILERLHTTNVRRCLIVLLLHAALALLCVSRGFLSFRFFFSFFSTWIQKQKAGNEHCSFHIHSFHLFVFLFIFPLCSVFFYLSEIEMFLKETA